MTAIWNASAVTPLATDRIPVDVSAAGAPSRWTGQNIADINTIIGGTVTALGSINSATALNLALGGYFSATITGNLTFSITNVPASAGVTFVLALTNGGAFTVTLPGSVTIIGGSPVLSAAGTDWLVFRTLDGGTAWTLEVVGNPRDADLATWATITPGAGVGTALGTNVGTAGAVVVNGGALGTPTSGVLTNCTFPTLNQNTSGYAEALKSATTTVTVSAATAPSSGQVLTATSSTAATWQTPSSGGTKTIARFVAADNDPPAASFATIDTRNSLRVLDFDDASVESAVFAGRIPEAAVLTSGILVKIDWMATSATTGNVRWRAEFERGTTDLDSDSFDTATEATGAANGTSGIATTTDITCTTIDSLVAGDRFRCRISRVGNDGTNDTMSGDAELVTVELRAV